MQPSQKITDLQALMRRLRAECPWDIAQTNQSLAPHAIEEAYELHEAIHLGKAQDVKDELGDVLLQVIFHACLYEEQGEFTFGDVVEALMQKLIRRHPHVFDKASLPDDAAVAKRWQEIKRQERAGKPRRRLDEVKAGSALMQAHSLQKQAGKCGFDFDDVADARAKLIEEIAELDAVIQQADTQASKAANQENKHRTQDELGDVLFATVNVARKLSIDSEAALLGTLYKFKKRFAYIEDELAKQEKTPEQATLLEMDALWEQAKTKP